ncbi:MAG: hypothetical protein QHI48_10075 [Bacteroidota bacterium]|nr:hypothetical protein [Bacteroidota bacterium]
MRAPHRFLLAAFTVLSASCAPCRGQDGSAVPHAKGNPVLSSLTRHTGCHLPSAGRIRGLVLFVQTLNDDLPDENWPLGRFPSWGEQYARKLETYIADMSCGKQDLTLDIVPRLLYTNLSEQDYLQIHAGIGLAMRDLLTVLDDSIDFAPYDNWQSVGRPYRVIPGADGQVDLIIVVIRRIANPLFFCYSGVSDLAFDGVLFVDDGQRQIYGGTGEFNDAGSSGLIVTRQPGSGSIIDEEWAFRLSIHELFHKIYGEGHPAILYGGLGVLSQGSGGIALNSYERHVLGYISFIDLPPAVDTVFTIRDYVTTGEAAALPIPEAPSWYYTFEYRTRRSPYDTAPAEGVFIYRVYDPAGSTQKQVKVISADGNFQWGLDAATGKLVRLFDDPIGGSSVYDQILIGGKPYYADGWWGEPRSAFTMERRNFTIWHNPSPDFIRNRDTVRTGLFIAIESITDSTASIRIRHHPPQILDSETPAEQKTALFAPYPNPVISGGEVRIPLHLAREGKAVLHIFDTRGRRVDSPVDAFLPAGRHVVRWDASRLAPGIYACVLHTSAGISHRMFVVEP